MGFPLNNSVFRAERPTSPPSSRNLLLDPDKVVEVLPATWYEQSKRINTNIVEEFYTAASYGFRYKRQKESVERG